MQLTLLDKIPETEDVWTFRFKPESPLTWQAGQFLIYSLSHKNEDVRGKMRFFTISSAPFEKNPSITTRINTEKGSSFKKALMNLKQGDTMSAKGPDGHFVIDDPKKNYVFLAGGIGITPFYSILKEFNHTHSTAKEGPINITLLYSNKSGLIPLKEELDEITNNLEGLEIIYLTERIDKEIIKENVSGLHSPIFYISGPEPMVEALSSTLKETGALPENIREDFFPGYET